MLEEVVRQARLDIEGTHGHCGEIGESAVFERERIGQVLDGKHVADSVVEAMIPGLRRAHRVQFEVGVPVIVDDAVHIASRCRGRRRSAGGGSGRAAAPRKQKKSE